MKRLEYFGKVTVAGSSIIETVVSSLIFLTVFMLSLDVVTSLTIRSDSDVDLISADVEIENLIRAFDSFPLENRTLEYPWGEMEISIQDYDVYHALVRATVKCRIESSGTVLTRDFIYCIDNSL